MAGTINLSLDQIIDKDSGHPLSGGMIYFYQAGTTTPQSAYKDSGLTLPHPNPIVLDSTGYCPQFFLADGSIKIRITNSVGVVQLAADGVLVIGASSGGGGGSPVDATTVLATGDIKVRYGTGNLSGFVRLNGRTIGSATSGATERANADTQALFEYLWGADTNLSVSTGRGVSANADWTANKTLTLPDGRGRVLAALDDMGASAAGRLTATYFGATATTLGAVGGLESWTVVTANLPAYTPAGTIVSTFTGTNDLTPWSTQGVAGGIGSSPTAGVATKPAGTVASTFTGTAQGGTSTPLRTVQPTMLVTNYIKL